MRNLTLVIFSLLLFCTTCGCSAQSSVKDIDTFEQCVSAGYGMTKSFPARCSTPDGRTFIDSEAARSLPRAQLKLCQDLCGDGECQQIVCMGEGCPCAETPETCPADCK